MKRIRGLTALLAVVPLAACDLDLSSFDCEESRRFSDEISATGINALLVDDLEGDLRIEGRSGINEVRVRATACSNDRRTADDIDFRLYREDGEIRVISEVPGYDRSRLDLIIEVPVDFDVAVFDTDGHMDIEDVFSVWIADGSGHIDVNGIENDVTIDEDGSGDIDVRDVGGDFYVRYDGSGRIDYSNVRGYVDLP